MPGGHHGGHHGGGHRRGGGGFGGWWGPWPYYEPEPVVYVLDPYALDEGDIGQTMSVVDGEWDPPFPALPRRDFLESERAARKRAERDPATRDRITWAHEHLSRSTGVSAAAARRGALVKMPAGDLSMHIRRAGLTLGEAEAAGMGKGYR